jgi:glyceraldehyde-3-phosphate dehydrogenase/erythrose-4-phosphate dehydrogenase
MIRNVIRFGIPVLLLLLAACRTPTPVYNVTSAPVVANKALSSADVQKVILQAGTGLGWQMIQRGPGSIEGVLVLREHRAVVDIKYSAKSYSITYKDSEKLNYDGTNIHPNYNSWIQNLDRAIRAQLTAI